MEDLVKAMCQCGAVAVWHYMPFTPPYAGVEAQRSFCDACVPRLENGCSCNVDPNTGKMDMDVDGRHLPCIEYDWIGDG